MNACHTIFSRLIQNSVTFVLTVFAAAQSTESAKSDIHYHEESESIHNDRQPLFCLSFYYNTIHELNAHANPFSSCLTRYTGELYAYNAQRKPISQSKVCRPPVLYLVSCLFLYQASQVYYKHFTIYALAI